MTEQDTDFEFDFFEDLGPEEEPSVEETTRPQRAPRRGGPPPPRRPVRGPTGVTPLLRLAGLIAFAILVIVLLVYGITSCGGSGKRKSFESYFEKVAVVGKDSGQIGRELTETLTTPGIKAIELDPRISGLAQREEQNVAAAVSIKPPGALREEHQGMLQALRLRVAGLRGLAATFRQTAGSKNVARVGERLALQAQRLVAADVVWDDFFRLPTIAELKREGVTGVAPPDSNFVSNSDFGSPRYWVPIVERLTGASTGGTPGGLHGSGLVSTKALPEGKELSPDEENTITAGTDLGFAVTVENTGDSQEVQVKVTLTIQQQPSPIVATQTIDLINPGEQKTVVFRNLGQVQFATKTTIKVDIAPVPGEKNTDNNSAEYPAIFSLG